MANIRDIAKTLLDANVPDGAIIASTGSTAAEFTRLCNGTTQAKLEAWWKAKKDLTACMDFVGWYGIQMRAKVPGTKAPTAYLGGFELEAILKGLKMEHAWIKSADGRQPQYGDICRHSIYGGYHVGVALDFDGKHWNHVDAGQGSHSTDKNGKVTPGSCDIVKRTHGDTDFNYKNLIGWIDIDMYYSTRPQTGPVPDWLPGWWKVTWRQQTFYYYFDAKRTAKWTQTVPSDTSQPLTAASDTGNFALEGTSFLTILWGATGSIERLGLLPSTTVNLQMSGTWNGTEPLSAEQM